jgi:CubicO group peptidase (beta-lactamase class C family)
MAHGSDSEVGASFAVIWNGELLVDLWGGFKDVATEEPWQQDTLVCCWSVSKSLCSTLGLGLVDAGLLDLDAPVCAYWPEFGQNGKADILVRHLFEHRAPVVFVDADLQAGDVFDWDIMVQAIETTAPNWPIGPQPAYLNLTYGYLLGELFSRVNGGQRLGQFVRNQLTKPRNLDWHFEVPDDVLPRLATVYQDPPIDMGLPPDSIPMKSMKGYDPDVDYNSLAYHKAEMGSGSSHTNARGMAQLYAMLIQDTAAFGPKLLTDKTLALASTEAAAGDDPVVLTPMRYSTGFELTCPPALPLGPSDQAFGYIGAGGSLAFADPTTGLSIGYSANFMHMGLGPGPCGLPLVEAALEAVRKA